MSGRLIIRNAVTNDRYEVDIRPGESIRDAVDRSGSVAANWDYIVRAKNGQIIDDAPASRYAGTVVIVGYAPDRS